MDNKTHSITLDNRQVTFLISGMAFSGICSALNSTICEQFNELSSQEKAEDSIRNYYASVAFALAELFLKNPNFNTKSNLGIIFLLESAGKIYPVNSEQRLICARLINKILESNFEASSRTEYHKIDYLDSLCKTLISFLPNGVYKIADNMVFVSESQHRQHTQYFSHVCTADPLDQQIVRNGQTEEYVDSKGFIVYAKDGCVTTFGRIEENRQRIFEGSLEELQREKPDDYASDFGGIIIAEVEKIRAGLVVQQEPIPSRSKPVTRIVRRIPARKLGETISG